MKQFVVIILSALMTHHSSLACTRAVYFGVNNEVITARTMDWKNDIETNLRIFPQGLK
ncbi:MAG: hypothetical protein NDI69_11125 [Bacteriovoracaceae bacterium]|nr:hypothetical protein [Bacteriovoracaceae bacterium]